MDTKDSDLALAPSYEMLLTACCQTGLASSLGWRSPVADCDAARPRVISVAAACGDPAVRALAEQLKKYIAQEFLRRPLSPQVCGRDDLKATFHIVGDSKGLLSQADGKSVLVWDAGQGSRMGGLLQPGHTKGSLPLGAGRKLLHFSAGAAQWCLSASCGLRSDYFAFVAADQVVCLDAGDEQELADLLHAAALEAPDIIFFDVPPVVSLTRLRFLISAANRPQRNGLMALARDRLLLKEYGGAHVFQCALLKRTLMPALAATLEAILDAARVGCDVDYGVHDIAVIPMLLHPRWLRRDRRTVARRVYEALMGLRSLVRRVRPISMPLEVFNVNTPRVLEHLRARIDLAAP